MVAGLLGNESSDSNRFILVTPKSENDVRLQATLGNQNPTGWPVGVVRLVSNDIDYYEMVRDLKAHGYPIILREPSLTRKQLLKRQTAYFFQEPLEKPTPNETEAVNDEVKKLIEFNDGNDVIASSKIRCYLKTKKMLDKDEINKTIEKIRALYKVVEVRGKEEFYKIT